MLMPEIGASNVMKSATQAPAAIPVKRLVRGSFETASTTVIRMKVMRTSAPKARARPAGPGIVTAKLTAGCRTAAERKSAGDEAAGERPDKLRGRVEERIRRLHLAEPQERQCRRGVDVRPAPLPPARVDDRDGRHPHRQAHQRPADEGIRQRGMDGRSGMLEERGEDAGRHHEEPEERSLDEVFRPVRPKGRRQDAVSRRAAARGRRGVEGFAQGRHDGAWMSAEPPRFRLRRGRRVPVVASARRFASNAVAPASRAARGLSTAARSR